MERTGESVGGQSAPAPRILRQLRAVQMTGNTVVFQNHLVPRPYRIANQNGGMGDPLSLVAQPDWLVQLHIAQPQAAVNSWSCQNRCHDRLRR